jgi:hypothetical protein
MVRSSVVEHEAFGHRRSEAGSGDAAHWICLMVDGSVVNRDVAD